MVCLPQGLKIISCFFPEALNFSFSFNLYFQVFSSSEFDMAGRSQGFGFFSFMDTQLFQNNLGEIFLFLLNCFARYIENQLTIHVAGLFPDFPFFHLYIFLPVSLPGIASTTSWIPLWFLFWLMGYLEMCSLISKYLRIS